MTWEVTLKISDDEMVTHVADDPWYERARKTDGVNPDGALETARLCVLRDYGEASELVHTPEAAVHSDDTSRGSS